VIEPLIVIMWKRFKNPAAYAGWVKADTNCV